MLLKDRELPAPFTSVDAPEYKEKSYVCVYVCCAQSYPLDRKYLQYQLPGVFSTATNERNLRPK
jgi:hypothetical protein